MNLKYGQKAIVFLLTLSFLGLGAAPASAFCKAPCCSAPQTNGRSHSGAAYFPTGASIHPPSKTVSTDRCCFLQKQEGVPEALTVSRPFLPKAERALLAGSIPLFQGIVAQGCSLETTFVHTGTLPGPIYLWNSSFLI